MSVRILGADRYLRGEDQYYCILCRISLFDQVRGGKANKFPRRYYLGFLPESGKMSLIAGNQVVGSRGIGAFDKNIVVRVSADFKAARGRHDMAVILDEL